MIIVGTLGFFPLRVCAIFNQFQIYVEHFFSHKIKCVQSDWGCEYRSLSKILQQKGITYRLLCPHTHQQNGNVERKHCHIVETGLALLSHAKMPLHFWDDAFVTACYLINRMPNLSLHQNSPFEILFHSSPDYGFLKVFGCACWPNFCPYNKHKLQPRSLQCIFMGYNLCHKGYKCVHLPTKRIYFSRDVIFQETTFPYDSIPSFLLSSPPSTSQISLPHVNSNQNCFSLPHVNSGQPSSGQDMSPIQSLSSPQSPIPATHSSQPISTPHLNSNPATRSNQHISTPHANSNPQLSHISQPLSSTRPTPPATRLSLSYPPMTYHRNIKRNLPRVSSSVTPRTSQIITPCSTQQPIPP